MQAVAHNPAFAKKAGVPQSVGKEFTKSGGGMAESKKMVKKEVSFMKKKGAPKSMIKHEMGEMKGMKKGGMTKKMAVGGVGTPTAKAQPAKKVASAADIKTMSELNALKKRNQALQEAHKKRDPVGYAYTTKKAELAAALGKERAAAYMKNNKQPRNVRGLEESFASMMKPRGMFGSSGIDKKNPKTQAERDYLAHQAANKGLNTSTVRVLKKGGEVTKKMASGGLAAGHKSADGIASKGKTKGKMMAKGGIAMKKGKYC